MSGASGNCGASLAGRHIVVTRPRAQAAGLAALIEAEGGIPVVFPVIDIQPALDQAPLVSTKLGDYQLAVFISPNAVDYSLPSLLAAGPWPNGLQAAAVGAGTVKALEKFGISGTVVPSERFDSEGLLELPALQAERVAGQRVLILRGDGGRELIADTLRERGATVDYLSCYRRLPPGDGVQVLSDLAARGALDALTVSSSEGLRNLQQLLEAPAQQALGEQLYGTPCFVPHARIAEVARELGYRQVILTGPADAGLIAGLCAYNWPPRETSPSGFVNMTPHTENTPAAATPEAVTESIADATPAASAPPPAAPSLWQALRRNPWVLVALIALALAAWQWVETRLRLADTQQELSKRLAESDTLGKESRVLAKQSQEDVSRLQAKLGALDAKLTEAQGQQTTLENLYQELARNRDDWLLADVEQSISLAAQQLQLAGNVQAALLALQAADSRLARAERPQFIALRKSIGRDLDRLKAIPAVDLSGMSLRLENVVASVDTLTLAADERPKVDSGKANAKSLAAPAGEVSLWQRFGLDLWTEIKGLVRIQRFDRPEPALLAPEQSFFLRENLKLRLLNARLALLAHDQWTFRNELKLSQSWLERYFDPREKAVQAALVALRQLAATEIVIDLPNLNESLTALRNLKAPGPKERR
jgi:uroporphyrin-3 C-methyltransferase